ncbi:flavodoxin [Pedobacter sp. MC2016-14]|uniref:flavodoxin n=1 Tax=Pedobacter sp. MC2016-14 TaxID=2897327 RepID=UPI001E638029|nr:flavodoxin [Pedobacter sp. MC2016-14]MCD0487774.1 flavodoxin [Pedobacter sp. MC2016-14]
MNKNIKSIALMTALLLNILCGCSKAQSTASEKGEMLKDKNVLIVYLSRTKNTKAIAEMIHKNVGGTLASLELKTPYPEDYKAIVDQVAKENETGYLPPLATQIDNMEKYDIIFLGFPTWGMQLPPPVKSFLKQYNFKGKTLVPFNTNAGYGIGSSFDTVRDLSPGGHILEGYTTKGGIERDGVLFVIQGTKEKQVQVEITTWLKKLKMII